MTMTTAHMAQYRKAAALTTRSTTAVVLAPYPQTQAQDLGASCRAHRPSEITALILTTQLRTQTPVLQAPR